MSAICVKGGRRLDGSIRVQGAKNSVLPVLAAAILADGESVIHNCPDLSDVRTSIGILQHLGCKVKRTDKTVCVDASELTAADVPDLLMREMRSSVVFMGAILGRMGSVSMCTPGGCELGARPIDLHLKAIQDLGAQIDHQEGRIICSGRLTGSNIVLSVPSVGATENAMLAAVAARGNTMIINAAREPEIVDLQRFLRILGADVWGAGGSAIMIEGGKPLHGGEFTVMGDRIAAVTYLAAGVCTRGQVEVTGVDWRHISAVTSVLAEAGCSVHSGPESVFLRSSCLPRCVRPVRTAPYPGFPTDAQAVLMAAMAKSRGTTLFVENIFDSRYWHVDELRHMGADITVAGRAAVVHGVPELHGAAVCAHDLRGGAALILAALGAEGISTVDGLHHIDRGYHEIEECLRAMGADICRT